jgi:hypothetical protein
MIIGPKLIGQSSEPRCLNGQVTSLDLLPQHKRDKHSKYLNSSNKHNTQTGLDIRASLGLSSNWGLGTFRRPPTVQGGRLMTDKGSWPEEVVPGAAGEAQTSVSGRQGQSQQL